MGLETGSVKRVDKMKDYVVFNMGFCTHLHVEWYNITAHGEYNGIIEIQVGNRSQRWVYSDIDRFKKHEELVNRATIEKGFLRFENNEIYWHERT